MARKRNIDDPAQILLFATLLPNGSGGFQIVPQKPMQEIDADRAAQMLNVARSTLSYLVNTEKGQKHLRWRWLTDRRGKRVFDMASIMEYREASKDSEF